MSKINIFYYIINSLIPGKSHRGLYKRGRCIIILAFSSTSECSCETSPGYDTNILLVISLSKLVTHLLLSGQRKLLGHKDFCSCWNSNQRPSFGLRHIVQIYITSLHPFLKKQRKNIWPYKKNNKSLLLLVSSLILISFWSGKRNWVVFMSCIIYFDVFRKCQYCRAKAKLLFIRHD